MWNNQVIAESDMTIVMEGNHYFPPTSIKCGFLNKSDTQTSCFWKGEASYLTISVAGQMNIDAAWYYPAPKLKALNIKGYVAFWKGVSVAD